MVKFKPLLPVLREKKRYLSFEVLSDHPVDFQTCKRAISEACHTLYGRIGTAQMGLVIMQDKYAENKGILRVSHRAVHMARAALCFVQNAGGAPCIMRSLKTSGILNKA